MRWDSVQLVDRHPVGETGAALVEQDQPRERGEPLQEPGKGRLLPRQLDVRHPAGHEYQIERTLPYDLVGNMQVAATCIFRFSYRSQRIASASPSIDKNESTVCRKTTIGSSASV